MCLTHRKNLDDKSMKCILVGVSDESKANWLYNPLTKKVLVSRDVVFDEKSTWNLCEYSERDNTELTNSIEEDLEEEENVESQVRTTNPEIDEAIDNSNAVEQSNTSTATTADTSENHSRTQEEGSMRRRPNYLSDYITDNEETDELSFAVFSQPKNPMSYEEAARDEKWRRAMQVEIEAIERSQTWTPTDLPKRSETYWCKMDI